MNGQKGKQKHSQNPKLTYTLEILYITPADTARTTYPPNKILNKVQTGLQSPIKRNCISFGV